MKDGENVKLRAFRAAFPYTLPIFAGFWFIGLAYGIYMNVSGFSFVYPMVMSAVIFGGSLEFVAVSMLLSPFAPLQTLMAADTGSPPFLRRVDARKIQGARLDAPISDIRHVRRDLLDKLHGGYPRGRGPRMVHVLRDAAESALLGLGRDARRDFGLDADLRHRGHRIRHDGHVRSHLPGTVAEGEKALDGAHRPRRLRRVPRALRRGLLRLALFGADSFLIPSMLCILFCLSAFRGPIEKAGGWAK